MDTGEIAIASAAATCAVRFPPNSRAMQPVSTIAMPCASEAKNRRPTSDGPKSVNAMRAIKGVTGGYAT